MSFRVVFQREGHNVETIYWAGPLEETRELARRIAIRGGGDAFEIQALGDCDAEGVLAGRTVAAMGFLNA